MDIYNQEISSVWAIHCFPDLVQNVKPTRITDCWAHIKYNVPSDYPFTPFLNTIKTSSALITPYSFAALYHLGSPWKALCFHKVTALCNPFTPSVISSWTNLSFLQRICWLLWPCLMANYNCCCCCRYFYCCCTLFSPIAIDVENHKRPDSGCKCKPHSRTAWMGHTMQRDVYLWGNI